MLKRHTSFLASLLGLVLLSPAPDALASGWGGLKGLEPGEVVTHELDIPVRVVLIGFGEDQVEDADILAALPATYTPVVRYPQFYGIDGRNLGLEYTFDYKLERASHHLTKRFFKFLKKEGVESPRTFYQTEYNNQQLNLLEVPETVLFIDAPTVEKWLEKHDRRGKKGGWHRHRGHGGRCKGDDEYTIYFINWYGRDDFKFHLYTKTDDPDPDTGLNFGEAYSSRKVRAWGGTSSRNWFFDFSAGPEWNGGSYVVDDKDTATTYRIPVIWEYSSMGYRDPADLDDDMGYLSRFVAINLLFTSSPLYDPLVTAPAAYGRKVAHVTLFEDDPDPAENGVDYFNPAFAREKLATFEPYYRWRLGFRNVDPIGFGAKRAFDTFTENDVKPGCWQGFGTPFAQLFCYFDATRNLYVPRYRHRDYVAPVFSFNTTDEGMGTQFGLLGFADDNWVDGTQSYVFTFNSPGVRDAGYGLTATTVHEVGHHIGLSHPHDGWDSELGLDYGSSGDFYFAWAGDESDTVMHYITLSNGFGMHNQDNMYRWEAAGYLNRANVMAGDLLASPKSWRIKLLLRLADRQAALALRALEDWSYLKAAIHARVAWTLLARAAEQIGVTSARLAAAQQPLPNAATPRGCRPRFPEH